MTGTHSIKQISAEQTEQDTIPSLYKLMQFKYKELLVYYMNNGLFCVSFDNTCIQIDKNGFIMSGIGKTLEEACADYIKQIKGKTLILDYNDEKTVFIPPKPWQEEAGII